MVPRQSVYTHVSTVAPEEPPTVCSVPVTLDTHAVLGRPRSTGPTWRWRSLEISKVIVFL